MIKIEYEHDGEARTITASGLGDLGWQLDSLGCDTWTEDENYKLISIEMMTKEESKLVDF